MKSFKPTKEKYDKLKKNIGIEKISDIHSLIEKGDKKGLIKFANNLSGQIKQDCLRIAKYL